MIRSGKDIAEYIRELAKEADALDLVRVTSEQLRDWAEVIEPQGFLITGLDAAGLVKLLSEKNVLTDVMREACALYGMELVMTDKHTLTMQRTGPHAFGHHIGELLTQVQLTPNKWYDFNATFKLTDSGVELAMEGLQETHQ